LWVNYSTFRTQNIGLVELAFFNAGLPDHGHDYLDDDETRVTSLQLEDLEGGCVRSCRAGNGIMDIRNFVWERILVK
jgi:hypothetical protein